LLLQSVFTAKYFCLLSARKYRAKAVEPFSICTRGAGNIRGNNPQHTENAELKGRAVQSPRNRHLAALLLTRLHDARIARLQKFFTSRNFFRAVPCGP